MKRILLSSTLAFLFACNNNAPTTIVKSAETKPSERPKPKAIENPVVKVGIEGFYTGMFVATKYDENKQFYDNKITICIDSLDANNIYGHSIVAGNERPFYGTYVKENDTYTAILKEPGTDKYDGVFSLSVDAKNKKIKGVWVANDKKLAVTEREYELQQQNFKYDPSLQLPEDIAGAMISSTYNEETEKAEAVTKDVLKLNASADLLKSSDVENLYKTDLEVIRNAVYARHGYSFKNIRMRELFDSYVSWYMPVAANVEPYLTDIERKNIELIKRYEKHATKYYDVFGR